MPPARRLVLPTLLAVAAALAAPGAARGEELAALTATAAAADDRDPATAALLHRLADALADAARERDAEATGLAAEAQAAPDGAERARQGARRDAAAAEAAALRRQAIAALRRLADGAAFAGYARRDEALFSLGWLHDQAGEHLLMRAAYLRLIKDHPRSRYLPHAYLTMAEVLFTQGDLRAARRLYGRVVAAPDSRLAAYARYKRALCALQLGDGEAALADFAAVREDRAPHPTALERDAWLGAAAAWATARRGPPLPRPPKGSNGEGGDHE